MNDQNLFSILGRYVRRQNENLLTQSLAALFSHCEVFRNDLLDLFRRRSESKSLGMTDASCQTQSSQFLRKGRILVDLRICCGDDRSPQYVIEAKLAAPLSSKQARRYSEFVKARRGKARLVLLTMSGVDSELKKLLPKDTLWLTWTEIGELALRPSHKKTTKERFLCLQFYKMLEEREVPMARSVTHGEYRKLPVVNRFVTGKYRSLTRNNIDTINSIMARMRIFVENWNALTDEGYKKYDRLYAWRPTRNNGVKSPYAEIQVGFFLWKKRKHVKERYICLGINCADMKLFAWGGWILGKNHPDFDVDSEGKYLKEWPPTQSSNLFKMPLPDAERKIQAELEKCLRQFKRNRYYKA